MSVLVRSADPVRVAKSETPVGRILHEFAVSRETRNLRSVTVTLLVRQVLVRSSDPQRLHLAVEVAALQAESRSRLRHVPAMLLQFPQYEFPLVGAAGFMQRRIRMVGTFRGAAEEFGREMMRLDARLGANDDEPLDEVSQFPDISRPGITDEDFHGGVAELARFLSVGRAEFAQEISCQRGDVLPAVAQGRHVKGNHVQSIKKILAKSAAGNFLFEVFVRCGDDARVDAQGFVGTHALEALFLENAENFRLRAEAHVADFIEEERPAVGLLKFADLVFRRPGKAALNVPEQLGLDQLLGNGRAIDFHERALVTQTSGMQRARHELLAGTTLAVDQHAAVGRRRDGNLLTHCFHGNAVANNLVAITQFAAQQLVFIFEPPLLNGVANQDDDLFKRERFFDEIKSAELCGAHGGLDRAVTGNHDDRGRSGGRLQAAQRLEAVHPRKPDVQENNFEITRGGPLQGILSGSYSFHMVALVLKNGGERFTNASLVVHHEKMRPRCHRVASDPLWSASEAGVNSATGSSTRNRDPTGRLSSTWMLPPCSATIRAAMAKPSPVPRSLVEKCGRKSLSLSSGEMPVPVSETQISTVSASEWARVETRISRNAEFSSASAVLSMRFTTTLRSRPPSARTAGRFSARVVLRAMPSSRPENTSTA